MRAITVVGLILPLVLGCPDKPAPTECTLDRECSERNFGATFVFGGTCQEGWCVPNSEAPVVDAGPLDVGQNSDLGASRDAAPPRDAAPRRDLGAASDTPSQPSDTASDTGPSLDTGLLPDNGWLVSGDVFVPGMGDMGYTDSGPPPDLGVGIPGLGDAGGGPPDLGGNGTDMGGVPGLDAGNEADAGLNARAEPDFLNGCGDGFDNDNNGLTDCADPSCAADPGCLLPPEGGRDGECRDGDDNDNDGAVDCDDPGCFISPDCQLEVCDNRRDDDGDGAVDCDDQDCAADPGCAPAAPTLCVLRNAGYFNSCAGCHVQGNQSAWVIDNTDVSTLYESFGRLGRSGFPLVAQGHADQSYLWAKLNDTQLDYQGGCNGNAQCVALRGARMPTGQDTLSPEALGQIEAWLNGPDIDDCVPGGGGDLRPENCINHIDDDGDGDADCDDDDCNAHPDCAP
jgi:hypothetical protein